ncbi:MAG TPA: hypothetical protein VLF68_00595 [Candidatus Saccharimonadales bacterium]|nr:hypothetical protein [Candidatus Saccharimonadales bacterium]
MARHSREDAPLPTHLSQLGNLFLSNKTLYRVNNVYDTVLVIRKHQDVPKPKRHTQAPLPLHLADVLPENVKEVYDFVLPPKSGLQERYEQSLHSVRRGSKIQEKFNPTFAETNLEHVADATKRLTNWGETFPALRGPIDFDEAIAEIVTHDAGEAARLIGDVQPTDRTHRDWARKRLEPVAARRAIFPFIPDPFARDLAQYYYDRYVANNENDLTTQIAHLSDKVSGTVGAAWAFDVHGASKEKYIEIINHLKDTIPGMVIPAFNLMHYLPTEEQRGAIKTIMRTELDVLWKHGPRELVQPYREAFAA